MVNTKSDNSQILEQTTKRQAIHRMKMMALSRVRVITTGYKYGLAIATYLSAVITITVIADIVQEKTVPNLRIASKTQFLIPYIS
jgi:hypothetical protein